MGKDDGGCFMRIKILSGRNVPGCVPGIIPAANVICGMCHKLLNYGNYHCMCINYWTILWRLILYRICG